MKKYITALVLCMLVLPVFAAGRSTVGNTKTTSRGGVAPVNFKSSLKFNNAGTSGSVNAAEDTNKNTEKVAVIDDEPQPAVDRDKERTACISNNIGVGNTFVWAARDSNTSNYASMVEDTQNPDNNVCWVRLELKSNNPKITVSDFSGRYFEMGNKITCGSWIDEEKLEKRILDAKKTVRTLATIGGAVGGAGIGVGAMELFGNDLLTKAGVGGLQGQAGIEDETELYVSQLKALRNGSKKDKAQYNTVIGNLKKIDKICNSDSSLSDCKEYDYNKILKDLGEKK